MRNWDLGIGNWDLGIGNERQKKIFKLLEEKIEKSICRGGFRDMIKT